MRKFLQFLSCPRSVITNCTKPTFEDIKLAIWKQQIDKIEQLLAEGAPTHNKYQTILHFAVAENKIEAVEYISSTFFNLLNEKNEDGDTALLLAIFTNNTRVIKMLLHLSNLDVMDNNGNTAFIIAAANGNIAALESFMMSCNNTAVSNFEGQTALHRACYFGELETIKFLLEKTSLRFYQTDKNNNNSLHMACLGCNVICVRYIIKKVKNPKKLLNLQNNQGKRPINLLQDMIAKMNSYKKTEKVAINMQQVLAYVFDSPEDIVM